MGKQQARKVSDALPVVEYVRQGNDKQSRQASPSLAAPGTTSQVLRDRGAKVKPKSAALAPVYSSAEVVPVEALDKSARFFQESHFDSGGGGGRYQQNEAF